MEFYYEFKKTIRPAADLTKIYKYTSSKLAHTLPSSDLPPKPPDYH